MASVTGTGAKHGDEFVGGLTGDIVTEISSNPEALRDGSVGVFPAAPELISLE